MSLVQDLTPLNLQEEQEKFFAKNCQYNPQFKYKKLITVNKLLKYGTPKPEYLKIAEKILAKAFDGRTEEDIRQLEGELLTQEQAQQMIDKFLHENNMSEEIEVRWSDQFMSKASFYKNTFKIKLPVWHRRYEFLGTLYHELGTHALRRINYAQQPFFHKKKKLGFSDYLTTEEGLASIHTLMGRKFKLNYTAALNYLAVEYAQNHSFTETYQFIQQYIDDPQRIWHYTARIKRGLYDTSEGGGFTKDLLYLEGFIKTLKYLQETDYDLRALYIGKIAMQDVEKAWEMNPAYEPRMPSFYKNKYNYKQKILKISKSNLIY